MRVIDRLHRSQTELHSKLIVLAERQSEIAKTTELRKQERARARQRQQQQQQQRQQQQQQRQERQQQQQQRQQQQNKKQQLQQEKTERQSSEESEGTDQVVAFFLIRPGLWHFKWPIH